MLVTEDSLPELSQFPSLSRGRRNWDMHTGRQHPWKAVLSGLRWCSEMKPTSGLKVVLVGSGTKCLDFISWIQGPIATKWTESQRPVRPTSTLKALNTNCRARRSKKQLGRDGHHCEDQRGQRTVQGSTLKFLPFLCLRSVKLSTSFKAKSPWSTMKERAEKQSNCLKKLKAFIADITELHQD